MNKPTLRVAIIDAICKVVKPRDEWTFQSKDSDFDLPIAELAIDSLEVLELCMEIETNTGVELDPAELVSVATINELIGLVASKDEGPTASLTRAPRDRPLPLSLAQESVWNYCRNLENPSAYVLGMIDRIDGPLDIAKLGESLSTILRRHEIMRTTFPFVDGQPIQRVHPAETLALQVFDISSEDNPEIAIERIVKTQRSLVSNLIDGPLCRFALIKVRTGEHLLVRVVHHMLWDGWSGKLFLDELSLIYRSLYLGQSEKPPDISIQYGDYAAWQRKYLDTAGRNYHNAIVWWTTYFQDLPHMPDLPFKRPEILVGVDPSAGSLRRSIEPELMERLRRLQRDTGTSLYKIWLAGFLTVLALETNCSDVVAGIYVTNRRHRQLRNLIGDFSNTVVLRVRVEADRSFRELISRIGDAVVAIEEYSEIPYETLSKELQKRNVAVPQIRAIVAAPLGSLFEERRFADLRLGRYRRLKPSTMPWGFSVGFRERDEDYLWVIKFDARLYDPSLVEIFLDRLYELLGSVSRQPELRLDEIRFRK